MLGGDVEAFAVLVDRIDGCVVARSVRVLASSRVEAIAFPGALIQGAGQATPSFVVARASLQPASLNNLEECPGLDTLAVFGQDATDGRYRAVVPSWNGTSFSFDLQDMPVDSALFGSCFP